MSSYGIPVTGYYPQIAMDQLSLKPCEMNFLPDSRSTLVALGKPECMSRKDVSGTLVGQDSRFCPPNCPGVSVSS